MHPLQLTLPFKPSSESIRRAVRKLLHVHWDVLLCSRFSSTASPLPEDLGLSEPLIALLIRSFKIHHAMCKDKLMRSCNCLPTIFAQAYYTHKPTGRSTTLLSLSSDYSQPDGHAAGVAGWETCSSHRCFRSRFPPGSRGSFSIA